VTAKFARLPNGSMGANHGGGGGLGGA